MRKVLSSLLCVLGVVLCQPASAQSAVGGDIAPSGRLRVGSFVNGILYLKSADGRVDGEAKAVGDFMAAKLGVAAEPIVYPNPEAYAASFSSREWDVAIGPRSPALADKLDFSPDIALVDNLYIAAPGRDFAGPETVDRPGVKVGVALNGAPDQVLSRTLKSAELVRAPGDVSVAIELLRSGRAHVYASNGENIAAIAAGLPGSKAIGPFTTVRMAVGLPKGKSPASVGRIAEIVKEAHATGVVRAAIDRLGLKGVRVPD